MHILIIQNGVPYVHEDLSIFIQYYCNFNFVYKKLGETGAEIDKWKSGMCLCWNISSEGGNLGGRGGGSPIF